MPSYEDGRISPFLSMLEDSGCPECGSIDTYESQCHYSDTDRDETCCVCDHCGHVERAADRACALCESPIGDTVSAVCARCADDLEREERESIALQAAFTHSPDCV